MTVRLTDELRWAALLEEITPAIRQAGSLIERMKAVGLAERTKSDRSPVTEADEAAEQLLEDAIRRADPAAVVVGEEAAAVGEVPAPGQSYWLIDPLDGTRDFLGGGEDYSVNVGLVVDGVPVLGLVLHPPSGTLWSGARGLGAWKESARHGRTPIHSRPVASPPVVVTSRSHLDPQTSAWVAQIDNAIVHPSGSSIKLCLVAEGTADIYPRFGPTSEWDTAAADAVLRAAGGRMLDVDGSDFCYGRPRFINPPFLAVGDREAPLRLPPFRG